MSITTKDIHGAMSRAWCHSENEHKIMDTDLALAAAEEIETLIRADKTPYLGCATTKELIDELAARADVSATVGEDWPFYRTIGE